MVQVILAALVRMLAVLMMVHNNKGLRLQWAAMMAATPPAMELGGEGVTQVHHLYQQQQHLKHTQQDEHPALHNHSRLQQQWRRGKVEQP
jgi:hypothetical protein